MEHQFTSPAPQTLDGWFALHDFRIIDWQRWKGLSSDEKRTAMRELSMLNQGFSEDESVNKAGFGMFAVVGHKADLLFLHFRPSVEELIEAKYRLNQTRFADFLSSPYSYFSVVELSSHLAKPGVDPLENPATRERLQPKVPAADFVCFYPMNKKRVHHDNWYTLSEEERREYLMAHGTIGRTYAGRVKQIITGSMGLDDWEWGVTLFADDPLQFKKLVYEMRFDEGSARFGEFGPFLVGERIKDSNLSRLLRA